jgi:hypothetical protein
MMRLSELTAGASQRAGHGSGNDLELEAPEQNADDMPWNIVRGISEKAAPLADDLHEPIIALEK